MQKRRKQIFKYYLDRWKQHKHISFGYKELRTKDWYRLIEIIKRGGIMWLKQPHKPIS